MQKTKSSPFKNLRNKFWTGLALILGVLVMSLTISYLVLAWTEPTLGPPQGNVSAPINISTTPQAKEGALVVGANSSMSSLPSLIVQYGNVGIGDTSPASLFTVGSGDLFQVNSSGDIIKIRNITYSWPSAQGGASTFLQNNGTGTLSWAAGGGGAPVGATYITQTSNATLTNEQALSALTTGYMKVTTTSGIVSSQAVPIPATDGGTNQTSWATGDMLYASGVNTLAKRTIGSAGQVLTVSGEVPTWAAAVGGGVGGSGRGWQIPFWSGALETSSTTLDFTGMYWDNSNMRLGIRTNAPLATVHIKQVVADPSMVGLKVDANPSPVVADHMAIQAQAWGGTTTNNAGYFRASGNAGTTNSAIFAWAGGAGYSGTNYAIYGRAESAGTNYGIYGRACCGTTNWGLYIYEGNAYFNGNVGIGTTSPGAKLHTYESTALGSTLGNSRLLATISGATAGNRFQSNLWLYRDAAGSDWDTARLHDGISISDTNFVTPGADTRVWWERDPGGNIQSWGHYADTYLTINAGLVGIGTASPNVKLDVDGDIEGDLITAGGLGTVGYTSGGANGGVFKLTRFSSSRRYKENVTDFNLGLDVINKLRPVEFNWKSTGDRDFGFIAEDAEAINPLLATKINGETETFKYMQYTAILTNAIKEQQKEIDELKERLKLLEAKLNVGQ